MDVDSKPVSNGHAKEDDGLFMQCINCEGKFDDFEYEKIHFLETCCHIICKICFKKLVKKEYITKHKVDCPECNQQINDYEIKALLGAELLEKLQNDAMHHIVEEDKSLVSCPCGNAIEVEEGKVDYNQKDDNGKKLTRKAAEHMSKFRVRCTACKNNFCTSCNAQPYHIGQT